MRKVEQEKTIPKKKKSPFRIYDKEALERARFLKKMRKRLTFCGDFGHGY